MPWDLEKREGRWCVVKQGDGEVAGCHDSRADAIKQQRALYANESRMASMYAELDEQEIDVVEEAIQELVKTNSATGELVRIDVGNAALTASLVDKLDAMSERQARTEEALVAALAQIGAREPVVNVEAPSVTVEPAAVTVQAPNVTVEPPEVNVQAPNVSVTPEIIMPDQSRRIVIERDPFGKISGATTEEKTV
jgi:hypothetical protein